MEEKKIEEFESQFEKLLIEKLSNKISKSFQIEKSEIEKELTGWLSAEKKRNPPPKKGGNKFLIRSYQQFWSKCAQQLASKYQMQKQILDQPIVERMEKLCDKIGIEYPDCISFLFSYKYDELSKKLGPNGEINILDLQDLITKSLGYQPVDDQPKPGDVLLYIDSENSIHHTGVCLKNGQIISKIGEMNTFSHSAKNCPYGDSYVVYRNPGKRRL